MDNSTTTTTTTTSNTVSPAAKAIAARLGARIAVRRDLGKTIIRAVAMPQASQIYEGPAEFSAALFQRSRSSGAPQIRCTVTILNPKDPALKRTGGVGTSSLYFTFNPSSPEGFEVTCQQAMRALIALGCEEGPINEIMDLADRVGDEENPVDLEDQVRAYVAAFRSCIGKACYVGLTEYENSRGEIAVSIGHIEAAETTNPAKLEPSETRLEDGSTVSDKSS